MYTVDHLVLLIAPYREKKPLSLSTVSKELFGDGNRLRLMTEGKADTSSRRLRAAFQWFSDHWPVDAEWPADIPRPMPSSQPASAA